MSSKTQSRSSEHGALFEAQCRSVLAHIGFELGGREVIDRLGVEIDEVVHNKHSVAFFVEFKGSWMGTRPGLRRTDTTKKALASAYACHAEGGYPPFVILTSHDVKPDRSSERMLDAAKRHGALFDVINVNAPDDLKRLEWIFELEGHP